MCPVWVPGTKLWTTFNIFCTIYMENVFFYNFCPCWCVDLLKHRRFFSALKTETDFLRAFYWQRPPINTLREKSILQVRNRIRRRKLKRLIHYNIFSIFLILVWIFWFLIWTNGLWIADCLSSWWYGRF